MPAGITVYARATLLKTLGFDSWAHTWFLQRMVPPSRTWPTHESYWDIYTVPSTNEFTIHQTIIPTAFYWGFLAARQKIKLDRSMSRRDGMVCAPIHATENVDGLHEKSTQFCMR